MIECVPTVSVEVANVATWELFKVPVPKAVVPSLKVTVPVGKVEPVVVTVAVKVTETPENAGLGLEVRLVVVAANKLLAQAMARLLTSTEPRPVTRL